MIEYRDECCDCSLPCLGSACPNKHAPFWLCDSCGKETDPRELYKANGGEYCSKCVLSELDTVM